MIVSNIRWVIQTWFFIVLTLTESGFASSAVNFSVKIGVDPWPPFSFQGEGKLEGTSTNIIRAAFAQEGVDTEFSLIPWKRILQLMQSDRLDATGNLFYIPELASWIDYSDPYLKSVVRLASRSNFKKDINSIDDIGQEVIAYGEGYSFGPQFDKSKKIKKMPVPLTINGLKMMLLDRVDLVIDSEEVLQFLLKENPKFQKKIKILPAEIFVNPMSLGVRKNHPDKARILKTFNRGLEKLRRSGQLEKYLQPVK